MSSNANANAVVTRGKESYTANDVVPYEGEPDEEKLVMHPRCKLCASKNRREAEGIYEQTHNFSAVERKLVGYGEKISLTSISNHLRYHYERTKHVTMMRGGYADEVAQWMNFDSNADLAIRRRMAVLEREMHILAAQSDGLALKDRRTNAEQVRKLAETILNHESKRADFIKDMEPVQFIFKQLNILIQDKIKDNGDNPNFRESMVEILSELQDQVGSMAVETKP